ncbi:MAG: hypothetical protein KAU95_04690 [Candidatus Aenigmarchaeota archaeon]|nr:hypothetical protein [Candidatus Aenigmarchaeota archaeon]
MIDSVKEEVSKNREKTLSSNNAYVKSPKNINNELRLKEIINIKFGSHRGLGSQDIRENSKKAIYRAIKKKPVFVEFDIFHCKKDDSLRLGHPPQEPFEKLEEVYTLFKNTPTYPKVDIKLSDKDNYKKIIDKVIEYGILSGLNFILVNIGAYKNANQAFDSETYFCSKIKNKPQFKLNIDLRRYKNCLLAKDGGETERIIEKHVSKHKENIYSVSPEINEANWRKTAEFCKKHNIHNIGFWLRGWPDNPNPQLQKDTIINALNIEKQSSGLSINFDINTDKIVDKSKVGNK